MYPAPVFWIRDVYPGSEFFHPGYASKNLSVLTQKIVYKISWIWSGLYIPDPDPGFLPITDPGSMGHKCNGFRIRNTARYLKIKILHQCIDTMWICENVLYLERGGGGGGPEILSTLRVFFSQRLTMVLFQRAKEYLWSADQNPGSDGCGRGPALPTGRGAVQHPL